MTTLGLSHTETKKGLGPHTNRLCVEFRDTSDQERGRGPNWTKIREEQGRGRYDRRIKEFTESEKEWGPVNVYDEGGDRDRLTMSRNRSYTEEVRSEGTEGSDPVQ